MWKAIKYEQGSQLDTQSLVGTLKIRAFSLLVTKCLIVEGNLKKKRI